MSEGFFSRAAGQKRRAWLDSQEAKVANALRYYLGPTGIDRRANALSQVAPLAMSGTDYMDAATASSALSSAVQNRQPWEAVAQAGTLAGAGAAMMVPGVSYRMARGATDAGVSAAQSARRFATDEAGALNIRPRGNYAGGHTAPNLERGATMDSPSDIWGNDIYSQNALQWFGTGDRGIDAESLRVIQRARNNPNAQVTVYRAVPKNAPADINAGDWVTTSRRYAQGHGESVLGGNYRIVSEKVRAGELATDGNSLNEWGWWPDAARKGGIAGAASMLGVAAADVSQAMEQGPDSWQAAREKLRGLGMIE